ncbi:MAG: hypothetical protein JO362_23260 [Streptomycetaceae bacterium]|nr:hypothetical protein [Streptomycetaceae bacterium]
MTKDVIALTPHMPGIRTIAAALLATGPEMRLQSLADGNILQLCDDAGRPLLSVEAPLQIHTPGETTRLLGPAADTRTPIWWTEARASTAVPEAEHLAATFAGHLAHHLGGTLWPENTPLPPPGTTLDTSTTAAPTPAAAQPAVDVLTDRVAVVIHDRPVIAMTAWLSDALRACLTTNRALQIVTPPHNRLTLPTRLTLSGPPHRWVIRDGARGYYDGLSGAQLHWQDGAFRPLENTRPVAAFTQQSELSGSKGGQLLLSFRTRHPATANLTLGGALEHIWQTLTSQPPSGWGTAEPASLPWSRQQITDLARQRVLGGTWLVAVGTPDRPAIATLRIANTDAGVEEEASVAFGYRHDEQTPTNELPELAAALVTHHNLQSMLIQHRTGRHDLTIPAHAESLPVPIAFALGPEDVEQIGLGHALRPPIDHAPQRLGDTAHPGLYYTLGDEKPASGWAALERLTRHLRQ